MLIAKKTKETNIAEHVIYMFQVEDLIRANHLDIDTIMNTIIIPQIQDEELIIQYKEWYKGIIKQMKVEGVQKTGHHSDINEILMELLLLHNTIINLIQDKDYLIVFEKALPALKDFQIKSNASNINIVEVGFNALYSKFLLKLKGESFTAITEEAFQSISKMLGVLSIFYKKMKKGELNFPNN